ncbi:hypothetical protein PZA11_002490 [Diplocarpon coronariae]|uniref:Uncharacterized protein n=1 Tax=Diplocarpon coronariae TaxID=2795749 RepID=A0A218YSU4_9HELO|nr:hypothetical protein JHW43_009269 [Diplocarpon mali]OWO97579.1 hypothetical protein B2J93_8387 [Marssonina coronariae]
MLALVFLLLVGQAAAGLLGNAARLIRKDGSEEAMRRYIDTIISPEPEAESSVSPRQAAPPPGMKVNATQWDADTAVLCKTQLESLRGVASNPSGMAVCYNLPALDNSTGIFMADLRLYMIAAPTGPFADIASTNVEVGLSYNGATVSAVNASTMARRSDEISLISWPRDMVIDKREVMIPMLVQQYSFVGQVNKDLLTANMGTGSLQKVLVPTVTLTGQTSTGASVNTSLSSSEATFVNGVFSRVLSPTQSKVTPPIQTLVVAADQPFVVPGLNILIFPIGLVITSVWTLLFVGTIAYGTVGRMQFRDQFRRKSARVEKGGLARI